jgi:superfamily II DNA or RNA helicase
MIGRKLVYVLTQDPLIGVKFEARLVETLDDGSYGMSHIRIDPFSYRNFDIEVGENDKALLKILREITYDKLVTNFSKIRSDLPDLLQVKGEVFFKKTFRPYIERRLALLIAYCRDHAIPVYLLPASGAISDKPFVFSAEAAMAGYLFRWTPEALTYTISISAGKQAVLLTDSSLMLITDQPAWFAYRGMLFTMEGVNGNKIKPFLIRPNLVVPQQTEHKYFATFIQGLLKQTPIRHDGFRVDEYRGIPEPEASLCVDWHNDPVFLVSFRYGDRVIPMDYPDPRLVMMHDDVHPPSFDVWVRDLEEEAAVIDFLSSLGMVAKGGNGMMLAGAANLATDPMGSLVDFVRARFLLFGERGIRIGQPDSNYLLQQPEILTSVSVERDWFDLEIEIAVGSLRIPFRALKDNILSGKREFVTQEGAVFLIPVEWFSRFRGLFLFGKAEGKGLRINKLHIGSLDDSVGLPAMKEGGSPETMIRKLFEERIPLQGDASARLRPYQETGVNWLLGLNREGFGGCLADDMGLGKTIQVLALLDHLRSSAAGNSGTSLVVMPVSLLHNWEQEIRKFTPAMRHYRLAGPLRNSHPSWLKGFDIVLTTYGTLRNDIELLEKGEFAYLVLDESQHAKNAGSITFRSVMKINAANRVAMTGTPVENSLDDLWSQMTLVNKGLLGPRNWFREQFMASRDMPEESSKLLRDMVRPFILRRTKEAVAPELPQLTQEIRYCEPTEEQWSVYEARKSDIRNFLISRFREPVDGTTRMLVLQSLMRLRLIANHPVMADPLYTGGSGKLAELTGMIAEVVSESHKALVFSQFVKHLKLIAAELQRLGIPYIMMTGQDSTARREVMIRQFQNDDTLPVFLVSLKAGGVGLNLTRADYVFLADPWWNPAVENQAISRAHRIGRENRVFAYRFITSGTVEEKILQMQERKQNLADVFVNRNALNLIDPEEIIGLLS